MEGTERKRGVGVTEGKFRTGLLSQSAVSDNNAICDKRNLFEGGCVHGRRS